MPTLGFSDPRASIQLFLSLRFISKGGYPSSFFNILVSLVVPGYSFIIFPFYGRGIQQTSSSESLEAGVQIPVGLAPYPPPQWTGEHNLAIGQRPPSWFPRW